MLEYRQGLWIGGWLLLAGIAVKTLLLSFTYTAEAGLARLEEKYPDRRHRLARRIARWPLFLSTLNIGATICAVLYIGVVAAVLVEHDRRPIEAAWISVVVVGLLLLCMDIVPRALADSYADRLSMSFLPVVSAVTWLTWPLAWPLARLENTLQKRFEEQADEEHRPSTEEEVMSLVEQTDEEDLEKEEREIIRSVFEFGETVAREAMVPRVDIAGIEDTATVEEAAGALSELRFSRLLVYHETIDDIRGVAHVKTLLKLMQEGQGASAVSMAARDVSFVPESMPLNDLLQLLKSRHAQLAVVVDEYGGTAGLITMEDIIEELVGDIHDEYDEHAPTGKALADGSMILDARTPVDEANDELRIHIPESEEYDSVGGYVFNRLGRVPRVGELVEGKDFLITVQAADERRIASVRINRVGRGEDV